MMTPAVNNNADCNNVMFIQEYFRGLQNVLKLQSQRWTSEDNGISASENAIVILKSASVLAFYIL